MDTQIIDGNIVTTQTVSLVDFITIKKAELDTVNAQISEMQKRQNDILVQLQNLVTPQ